MLQVTGACARSPQDEPAGFLSQLGWGQAGVLSAQELSGQSFCALPRAAPERRQFERRLRHALVEPDLAGLGL